MRLLRMVVIIMTHQLEPRLNNSKLFSYGFIFYLKIIEKSTADVSYCKMPRWVAL